MKKNVVIFLTMCVMLATFVSCVASDANSGKEIRIDQALKADLAVSAADADGKSEHIAILEKIVKDARDVYAENDIVVLANETKISAVKYSSVKDSDRSSSEKLEDYSLYLGSLYATVEDMIIAAYPDSAVVNEFDPARNIQKPSYIVPDLEKTGFASAEEAVEYYRDNGGNVDFDVIILDYMMPCSIYYRDVATKGCTVLYPSAEESKLHGELCEADNATYLPAEK